MEWGGFAFLWRIVETARGICANLEKSKIEAEVDAHFSAKHRHYDFNIRIKNPLEQRMKLRLLRLITPRNGSLRRDDSPPLIIIGDDIYDDRDQYAKATSVMEIEVEVSSGHDAWINFAFVPPPDWRAGEFRAILELSILRAKEEKKRISIQRHLNEQS
jgi:hypothetical protein